jgi:hypothetical protein
MPHTIHKYRYTYIQEVLVLDFLKNLFVSSHQSDIEEFVASKNPKTPADVEHWIKVYTYGHAEK